VGKRKSYLLFTNGASRRDSAGGSDGFLDRAFDLLAGEVAVGERKMRVMVMDLCLFPGVLPRLVVTNSRSSRLGSWSERIRRLDSLIGSGFADVEGEVAADGGKRGRGWSWGTCGRI